MSRDGELRERTGAAILTASEAQHAASAETMREPRPGVDDAAARALVCGLVLCGGRSRRMGEDKAGLELSGLTLLQRAVEQVAPVCGAVVLACGPVPRYAELGHALVLDADELGGPVAGLVGALAARREEWFVVVACDMPRVDPDLLEALLSRARGEGLDACLFRSARGDEPLCAVYRRRCLDAMRAALARGERRVLAFADEPGVRVGRLEERELAPTLQERDCARNLNTRPELDEERAAWRAGPDGERGERRAGPDHERGERRAGGPT